ncbi:MAG TPA: 3-deoxy-D-manno-octulosonic acid transferase [Thiothrix sp.]|nr:3-deoxy-D-manno-octulosonic acid transferase [Thiothrix sp.]
MSIRRFLYTSLLLFIVPLMVLRLLWRSRQAPVHRQRIQERFGFYPVPNIPIRLWIHAVSVGEVIAAKNLVELLLQQYGDSSIVISTITATGAETVQRLFGDRVQHRYFPYDLPLLIDLSLSRVKPELFVVIETEIWPNFWHGCAKRSIPIILANARLSERATQRYLRLKGLVAETLSYATLLACRNKVDADNFSLLAAPSQSIEIIGDIKLDLYIDEKYKKIASEFRCEWGQRMVLVAASTHEGEDEILLDIYAQLKSIYRDLLLIIIPRHPERFDHVYTLIEQTGFHVQRRSIAQHFHTNTDIILGDTMGEMFAWYLSADLVFMGGSLVATGGHNPLEPAYCAKAVLSGTFIFNFTMAYNLLQQVDAAVVAECNENVLQHIQQMLADKQALSAMGERGHQVIEQHKGATARLIARINAIAIQLDNK